MRVQNRQAGFSNLGHLTFAPDTASKNDDHDNFDHNNRRKGGKGLSRSFAFLDGRLELIVNDLVRDCGVLVHAALHGIIELFELVGAFAVVAWRDQRHQHASHAQGKLQEKRDREQNSETAMSATLNDDQQDCDSWEQDGAHVDDGEHHSRCEQIWGDFNVVDIDILHDSDRVFHLVSRAGPRDGRPSEEIELELFLNIDVGYLLWVCFQIAQLWLHTRGLLYVKQISRVATNLAESWILVWKVFNFHVALGELLHIFQRIEILVVVKGEDLWWIQAWLSTHKGFADRGAWHPIICVPKLVVCTERNAFPGLWDVLLALVYVILTFRFS